MKSKIFKQVKHWPAGLILLVVLSWSLPALAWNATGHKNTAEIAFGLMLPEQRVLVTRILRQHPRFAEDFAAQMPKGLSESGDEAQTLWIFQQASIWPDILRGLGEEDRARFGRSVWHYINMPIFLEASDEAALDGKLAHNMSFDFEPPLRQNLNIVQALQGNLSIWRAADASDEDKAIALCWILHLVGDMHQPLHTVALFSKAYFPEGDRGGNSIQVDWDPEPTNLHAVWDRMPDRFDDLIPGDLTKDLLRSDSATVSAIDFWVKRHEQLARAVVYTDEVKKQMLAGLKSGDYPTIKLSEFYLSTGALLAKEQVILAGHRIAGLIQ